MMIKQDLIILKILFITIIFILHNISSASVLLDRIVAIVNGEVITWSELRDHINIDGAGYIQGLNGVEREEKIRKLEQPFLNQLIEIKIIEQAAKKLGLDVSDSELDRAIQEIKTKFNLSDQEFLDSLRSENMTLKDYRYRLKQQILIQKAVNLAVRQKIVVSEEDIDKYINDHPDIFSSGERWRIRQIFFRNPGTQGERQRLERIAEDIYKRLINGEDFASLAREFSQGAERETGGDLGYIDPDNLMPAVRDVALNLKTGEISRPFWSPAGLHIIKIEEIKKVREIEEIRNRVREILIKERFETKYQEWLSELKNNSDIEIKL
jgi:peptidyl-prolyl cis-trans isomerase SurA